MLLFYYSSSSKGFKELVESIPPVEESKLALHELPRNDYEQLIDLKEFRFLRSHHGCSKNDPKVVIMVMSAPANLNQRRVIRETWGSLQGRSLLLFLIGEFNDPDLEIRIERESKIFEDILQASFADSYRNLTYKHIACLKWFVYNCPNANFLLKTDDDVFVNTPFLLNYLENPSDQQLHKRDLIYCDIVEGRNPIRSDDSKWYVTREEFADDHYPNYCLGYAVLYSADAVFKLYQAGQTLSFFWIEDVQITGRARVKANLTITGKDMVTFEPERLDLLNEDFPIEYYPFIFGLFDLVEENLRCLWEIVKI